MFTFTGFVDALLKARGHRYIKRIPYMSGGRRRYRYIYKVTHTHQGKQAFDADHLDVGTAFALHTEAGAEFHGHITAVKGDQVTYRIDDGERKGESVTVSKSELLSQLNDVHGIESKLSAERDKLRSQIEVAREKGSEKQVRRLEERLARLGGEEKRAEPEPEPKKKRATRKRKKPTISTTYEPPPKLVTPELEERHLYAQHAIQNIRQYKEFLRDRGVKKRLPSDRDIDTAFVGYGNAYDDASVSAVQLSRSIKDLPEYRLKKTTITELPFPELHDKGIGLGVVVEDNGGLGLAFFVKRGQFAGNHYTITSYEKGETDPMMMMVDFVRRVKASEIRGSRASLFGGGSAPVLGFLRGVDDPRDFNILNRQIVELEEISNADENTLEYDGERYKYTDEKRATLIEDYGEEFTERLERRIQNLSQILEEGDPVPHIPTISDGDISLLEEFYNETTRAPSITNRSNLKRHVEDAIEKTGISGLKAKLVPFDGGVSVEIRKRGNFVGSFQLYYNNKATNDVEQFMFSTGSRALNNADEKLLDRAVRRMISNTDFKLKQPARRRR